MFGPVTPASAENTVAEGCAKISYNHARPQGALEELTPQASPHLTLVSPAATSPCVAGTGISATEGSQLHATVIASKSMDGISTTLRQKGYSLSDTTKACTRSGYITPSQPIG